MNLSPGITYHSRFFLEGITVTCFDLPNHVEQIASLDIGQYQLYVEAFEWFEFDLKDLSSMVFKAKQMSIQEWIRRYGDDGKESAMKEIQNLTTNDCFDETK